MTTIVGFGRGVAGDDGAGLAVLDALHGRVPSDVKLLRARDASVLVDLLTQGGEIIVVDAVLVPPERAGEVLVLSADDLDESAHSSVSTHGVSVAQAIRLSRTLCPETAPRMTIVAIGIERPRQLGEGLSTRVAQGVSRAVECIAGSFETNEELTCTRPS